MPKILVVDDSAVDRRLVGGLLSKELAVEVTFAAEGQDAIVQIAAQNPDLVITDILMPHLDGLGLVAQVRERFPMVPVVLMTSAGSEDLAFQALKCGASSYVPKRLLATELVDTVDRVLVAARQKREQARLLECLKFSQQHFELANDVSLISPLIACLQQAASQLCLFDDADRIRLGVALEEALVNAVYHGNLEVHSCEREDRTA
jgi:DNA-binding NtrC family response regulator